MSFLPKIERRGRFFASPLGRRLLSRSILWEDLPAVVALVKRIDARGIVRVGEWMRTGK